MKADQQDVVVGVRGRQHRRRWRAERSAPVDVLEPRGLRGTAVGADREAAGRARVAAIDVAAERDAAGRRAAGEDRGQLRALRVVAAHLARHARVQVGGAHVDAGAGGHAQPPAPLDVLLRIEVVCFGARDGRRAQHRVAEETAAARPDAGQRHAEVDHPREAQVVPRAPRDLSCVPAARLVERDRIGPRIADPRGCLVHHGRVVATRQPGQAEVHLHEREARVGRHRRRRRLERERERDGERTSGDEDHGRPRSRAEHARPQPTAFLTSSVMRASVSASIPVRANDVGHISPSSSLATSLKPSVA